MIANAIDRKGEIEMNGEKESDRESFDELSFNTSLQLLLIDDGSAFAQPTINTTKNIDGCVARSSLPQFRSAHR